MDCSLKNEKGPTVRCALVESRFCWNCRLCAGDVLLQESKGAFSRQFGGWSIVAAAHVAVEAVSSVIPVDWNVRMGGAYLVDLFLRDVRVLLAEVQDDGRIWFFFRELANTTGIITNGCRGMEPRRG